MGFVAGLSGPVVIDEVQRAPDLLLAIKQVVDRDLSPGRFLLTGSANVLTSRKVSDALTGRMETLQLWPLSQSEIHDSGRNIVDALFAGAPPRIADAPVGRRAFVAAAAGGFPEALGRTGRRRDRWFANYLATTLDRDLRDISDAHKLQAMPRLVRLLATQAANLLSYRAVASRLGLHHETVKAYVGLLEEMFLVRRLPAWRPGLGAREAATPKVYMVDSGLLASVLGADESRIAADDQITGKVLENFVAMEVLKHAGWADTSATLFHYQRDREDVDLVLERRDGAVVAIETKAAATLGQFDWRWLARLRDRCGDRFRAGIVIYSGAQSLPLGDRLWAVPVSGLWA